MVYNFGCLFCQILTYLSFISNFAKKKEKKKFGTKLLTNDKYVKIWQNKHPKLYTITFYIHHQKWVLWQGKKFSHTPDEAMSDGLGKACDLGEIYSVEENISYSIENQTE